jgi:hypothetical protein
MRAEGNDTATHGGSDHMPRSALALAQPDDMDDGATSGLHVVKRRKDDPHPTDAHHAYAECRVLGHSWRHLPPGGALFNGAVVGLRSQCAHCLTTRTKYLTRSGRGKIYTRYDYPKDYRDTGESKLNPHQWRRVLLVDLFAER